MHPGGADRRTQRGRYVLVLHPLLRPHKKHLTLHPRQASEAGPEPLLHLVRPGFAFRIGLVGEVVVFDRNHHPPLVPAVLILPEIRTDPEQRAPEARLYTPTVPRPDRPEERR